MFEPRQIGFDDLFIDLLREQQRDVDVDALPDKLANCGQAGLRGRHLDHQIVAADRVPQPTGLDHRGVSVHRQIGRDFEADISVLALGRVVDRAERVRRVLDILDRKPLVERHDIEVAGTFGRLQRGIVVGAAADGLFKDRGIGGDAGEPILLDELFETALGDKPAGEEIEPYGLPIIMQALERIHGRRRFDLHVHHVVPLDFAICSFAAARTLAGVKPNLVSRSLSGAEEPNVVMPTFAPVVPT